VAVITKLDPSVIAAQELENDGFDAESAIQELADALNDAPPGAAWRPVVSDARPGTDQITVGILYRGDRVDTVGAPAMKLDGPFEYGSRPLLAQSFRMDGGPAFTVVSIHFKSKGGCDNAEGADRDQGDGQACFNAKRLESSLALDAWIKTDPTGSGSDRVALIGDFNAYGMEDPMRALRERGWLDPLGAEGSYSFVFDGQSGRLDHALLSASFAADLAGAAKWHSNADEPLTFAYDGRLGRDGEVTPWRSSDHDPLLLGFRVESAR
jgi:predicted extracellular nuclease